MIHCRVDKTVNIQFNDYLLIKPIFQLFEVFYPYNSMIIY